MDEKIKKHLSTILEGYERSLQGVTEFIDQNAQQLETARSQRDEIVDHIAELKDMLGLEDEESSEAPSPSLVEDGDSDPTS